MIDPLETIKLFCGPTKARPELAHPFSYKDWSFGACGFVFVRVARVSVVDETTFGRMAGRNILEMLKWHWPKKSEADFLPAPQVAKRAKTIEVGGRFFNADLIRLIASMPNARIAVGKKRWMSRDEQAQKEGANAFPTAFVFGDGEGLQAEAIGMCMPLRRPMEGQS